MLTPRTSWASWRWMRVRGLSPSFSLSLALSGWDKWMPGLWRRLRYALRIKQRSKSAFSKIAVTAWSVRQSTQSHRNFIVVCNSTPLRSPAVYTVKIYHLQKSFHPLLFLIKRGTVSGVSGWKTHEYCKNTSASSLWYVKCLQSPRMETSETYLCGKERFLQLNETFLDIFFFFFYSVHAPLDIHSGVSMGWH